MPNISVNWLENNFINEEKVRKDISFSKAIPWNTPLVIYCFLMKRISNSKIPVIGCVERSSARRLATTVANELSVQGLPHSKEIKSRLEKNIGMYNMKDDHLFGTILEECTFLKPLEFIE